MRVMEGIESNCGHEGELESQCPWGKDTRRGEGDSSQLSDQKILQGNSEY